MKISIVNCEGSFELKKKKGKRIHFHRTEKIAVLELISDIRRTVIETDVSRNFDSS